MEITTVTTTVTAMKLSSLMFLTTLLAGCVVAPAQSYDYRYGRAYGPQVHRHPPPPTYYYAPPRYAPRAYVAPRPRTCGYYDRWGRWIVRYC